MLPTMYMHFKFLDVCILTGRPQASISAFQNRDQSEHKQVLEAMYLLVDGDFDADLTDLSMAQDVWCLFAH